jgi:hypothetical protein
MSGVLRVWTVNTRLGTGTSGAAQSWGRLLCSPVIRTRDYHLRVNNKATQQEGDNCTVIRSNQALCV